MPCRCGLGSISPAYITRLVSFSAFPVFHGEILGQLDLVASVDGGGWCIEQLFYGLSLGERLMRAV